MRVCACVRVRESVCACFCVMRACDSTSLLAALSSCSCAAAWCSCAAAHSADGGSPAAGTCKVFGCKTATTLQWPSYKQKVTQPDARSDEVVTLVSSSTRMPSARVNARQPLQQSTVRHVIPPQAAHLAHWNKQNVAVKDVHSRHPPCHPVVLAVAADVGEPGESVCACVRARERDKERHREPEGKRVRARASERKREIDILMVR